MDDNRGCGERACRAGRRKHGMGAETLLVELESEPSRIRRHSYVFIVLDLFQSDRLRTVRLVAWLLTCA